MCEGGEEREGEETNKTTEREYSGGTVCEIGNGRRETIPSGEDEESANTSDAADCNNAADTAPTHKPSQSYNDLRLSISTVTYTHNTGAHTHTGFAITNTQRNERANVPVTLVLRRRDAASSAAVSVVSSARVTISVEELLASSRVGADLCAAAG